ncbi:MAG: hypothetical protein AAFO07_08590 [Bacteroidota bacterium]
MRSYYLPTFCFLLLIPFISSAQIKVLPTISLGYMNHLNRSGYNAEVGINFELNKRLDIAPSFRFSNLDSGNPNNKVSVRAGALFLSYIFINNGKYRLLAGPGLSFGTYERSTEGIGFEKEYNDTWFNPLKARFDYNINEQLRLGFDASIYGDDSDGSIFLGLVMSYLL